MILFSSPFNRLDIHIELFFLYRPPSLTPLTSALIWNNCSVGLSGSFTQWFPLLLYYCRSSVFWAPGFLFLRLFHCYAAVYHVGPFFLGSKFLSTCNLFTHLLAEYSMLEKAFSSDLERLCSFAFRCPVLLLRNLMAFQSPFSFVGIF